MKTLLISIVLWFAINLNFKFSQENSSLKQILTVIFEHDKISKNVFTDNYKNTNAVYLYSNKALVKCISDYNHVYKMMGPSNGGMVSFIQSKYGAINLFLEPDLLKSISSLSIDKVIVIDKLTIAKKTAKVIFHTTNLDSEEWHKGSTGNFTRYMKFECDMENIESNWIVKDIVISDFPFKSVE